MPYEVEGHDEIAIEEDLGGAPADGAESNAGGIESDVRSTRISEFPTVPGTVPANLLAIDEEPTFPGRGGASSSSPPKRSKR